MLFTRGERVVIEVPSRTFDLAFPRVQRFFFWHRMRIVRRRFVVAGLPLRDLLVMDDKLYQLALEQPRVSVREACRVILGTADALLLTEDLAREIWEWWHEANCMTLPELQVVGAGGDDEISAAIRLVFKLERWPFHFATERIMRMTVAEANARLEEFDEAQQRDRERAAA